MTPLTIMPFKGHRRASMNRVIRKWGNRQFFPRIKAHRKIYVDDGKTFLVTKRRTVMVGDWFEYCHRQRSRGLHR